MSKIVKRFVTILIVVLLIITGMVCILFYFGEQVPVDDSPLIETPDDEQPIVLPDPPEDTGELVMIPKYEEYYEQNEDLIGWIRVPNTVINYPVVACSDNSFYLQHNFLKQPSKDGVPFLSMGSDMNDQSLSIFAHYLTSGKMFTSLHRYKKLDYYRKYPSFVFDTLYEEGIYKIFSVFYMAGNSSDKLFYYYPASKFENEESFMRHVKQIKVRSIFHTTVDVGPDDRLVLLTCCSYEVDNLRLIVAGRKVRPGELLSIDTENAELNPNPLYPQKWYDSKGGVPPDVSF